MMPLKKKKDSTAKPYMMKGHFILKDDQQNHELKHTHQSKDTILTLQMNGGTRSDEVACQHGHANTQIYYTIVKNS